MPSVEILKSHSVKTLRDEIAKSNAKLDVIKGYSKDMKKAQIIELMMKHKTRFHHIKMAEKTVRAPPLKSETAKKISKPAQQPAQQPAVIAPKKRVAKTATVIAPKKPAASKFLKQETAEDKKNAVDNLLKQIKKSYDKNKPNTDKLTDKKYKDYFNKKLTGLYEDVEDIYQEDLTTQKRFILRKRFSEIIPPKQEKKILKPAASKFLKQEMISDKEKEISILTKEKKDAIKQNQSKAPAPKKQTIKNDHANFSSLSIDKKEVNYEDKKQNIDIWLKFKKDNELYIEELNGYMDKKKKRAKKGLPRKVLCEIIHHLLNTDVINKSTLITLTPGDLGVLDDKFDMKKLKAMYESMGFKQLDPNDPNTDKEVGLGPKMGMDIKSFMKWCDSKYGGKFLDKWADK